MGVKSAKITTKSKNKALKKKTVESKDKASEEKTNEAVNPNLSGKQ